MLQFKELPEGAKCIDRPGSYGIITLATELVLVRIKGWGQYFLPGGGIDKGEHPEQALEREVIEETGYKVTDLEKIGEAAEYIFSPVAGAYINKLGIFYSARITDHDHTLIVEEDHEIVYLSDKDAIEVLHLDSHKWAVQQWIRKTKNTR